MKITIQVLISSDRVARLLMLIAHQIGLINTFVTRCLLMVPVAIFSEKFNTRLQIKYENEIQVLETCERVERLSIFIAHQTGLINTFVTKCYLMVSEAIFIVKFNTRLPKKDENYTLVLITSDRVARLSIPIVHFIDLINTFVTIDGFQSHFH